MDFAIVPTNLQVRGAVATFEYNSGLIQIARTVVVVAFILYDLRGGRRNRVTTLRKQCHRAIDYELPHGKNRRRLGWEVSEEA